mmetsp:Transcript_18837/g.44403  ORF Transcript_18837/g.44403 Transcript_18837/m.44403 type:complete len:207 (+) Transcript_18837:2494-3114(+)
MPLSAENERGAAPGRRAQSNFPRNTKREADSANTHGEPPPLACPPSPRSPPPSADASPTCSSTSPSERSSEPTREAELFGKVCGRGAPRFAPLALLECESPLNELPFELEFEFASPCSESCALTTSASFSAVSTPVSAWVRLQMAACSCAAEIASRRSKPTSCLVQRTAKAFAASFAKMAATRSSAMLNPPSPRLWTHCTTPASTF